MQIYGNFAKASKLGTDWTLLMSIDYYEFKLLERVNDISSLHLLISVNL